MRIDVVAEGLGFIEGPVCLSDERIAVTSISHGCVYLLNPEGTTERIITGGGPNGLAVGPDDTLFVAQNGGVFGGSGPAEAGVQVIRDGAVEYLATGMGAPNDLVFGPDGRLWVTDTRGQVDFFNPDDSLRGWVWALDPESGSCEVILDSGPVFLNGLGFSPDGTRLMVTSTCEAALYAYDVNTWARETLCQFDNGWPDGMTVGHDGNAWVALTGGDRLDLVSATGDVVGRAAVGEGALPTNVCFGAAEHELYVTASRHEALVRITLPDSE
ncbi:SMP-30/gluconolactonase/LRE family protein [Mycolicibacterium septicum DSM 44393]|uniref:SMP-30/gluconolactonase/LRE family protein n=1 Tax=Mycolicibacterium septicum DSM 44393 TaxID=1341646 RepID=A0A7X6MMI6_9MYCO|nr:SMP-30/gluconolactonase/LRE family protein [Mycolicibacterium septicum]NKZ11375.1 SMP-30/gluconolactonase/LRE family protein [Mycolicibacterium septicum DSM 44393]